jgi:Xaa-Pro aminopeptidase
MNERSTIVLSDLEIGRGRRIATVDEILSLSEVEAAIKKRSGRKKVGIHDVAIYLLHKNKITRVQVPADFPHLMAAQLERAKIRVRPTVGPFWPERSVKQDWELLMIHNAVKIAEAGLKRGLEVLRRSVPTKKKLLKWAGISLTSEVLRAEIDSVILRLGGRSEGTIVAGGEQACDPHERGHGALSADQLIILDIFPRDTTTGYYGDLTRTVVRGRASEPQRALWQMVRRGQEYALRQVRPGLDGNELQRSVRKLFADHGYKTEAAGGTMTGFFHGLGHGLGLEIHEAPRIAAAKLTTGNVFTIEPGLYYPGLGGVRIEDDIVVTRTGCRRLGRGVEKVLEI